MDAKWEKFDNTLSDLWAFFIPPIANTIILLVVFPRIPIIISDGFKYLITELKEVTYQVSTDSPLPALIQELVENSNILKNITNTTVSAIVPSIIAVAIFIFVLHKVVLISSRVIFGKIDIKEESLDLHPQIKMLIKNISPYIPSDPMYKSVHRRWEYAKSINDAQNNLGIYRNRRTKITSLIATNRNCATYAAAYTLASLISLFINIKIIPVFILFLTMGLFLLFSLRYFNHCISLIDLDIHTFLALSQYENKSTTTNDYLGVNEKIASSKSFLDHMDLFDGNILITFWHLLKGVKSAYIHFAQKKA